MIPANSGEAELGFGLGGVTYGTLSGSRHQVFGPVTFVTLPESSAGQATWFPLHLLHVTFPTSCLNHSPLHISQSVFAEFNPQPTAHAHYVFPQSVGCLQPDCIFGHSAHYSLPGACLCVFPAHGEQSLPSFFALPKPGPQTHMLEPLPD